MFKTAIPFFIRAITPVHAGSGNDLGVVDLPIQREKHTGFPKIEASTLKGSIRDFFEIQASGNENEEIKIHLIFGYDGTNTSENVKEFFENLELTQFSSAIAFADARILLFPIKSLKGVFAYATCPAVLKRFEEDLKMALKTNEIKINDIEDFKAENFKVVEKALISPTSKLKVQDNKVILEEYLFEVDANNGKVDNLAKFLANLIPDITEDFLKERLIILSDDDFADFVKLSTEVITRIKINNETGTVDQGALFTEEYLPTETIMYSIAFFSPLFIPEDKDITIKIKKEEKAQNLIKFFENCPTITKKEDENEVEFKGKLKDFIKCKTDFQKFKENEVIDFFKSKYTTPQILQIGGNETIGKGFIKVKLYSENI